MRKKAKETKSGSSSTLKPEAAVRAALKKLLLAKQRAGRKKDRAFLTLYRAGLRDAAKTRSRRLSPPLGVF